MSRASEPTRPPRERVLVCGLRLSDPPSPERKRKAGAAVDELEEVRGLVHAAGAEVVGPGLLQRRQHPDARTLIGKGKVEEIGEQVRRLGPDAVVVDNDLSPAQVRNLEKTWGCRVIDRSELILDIFARRARTRQAQLQVELAQNEYLLPRLRRMWTHLERMEAAIGTRGPGETQLETDRRLLRKRIQELKAQLSEIEARKRREVLSRGDQFSVGLVGYTNAGKSTLLNALTGSDEFVADMLFATLDTRTRRWRLGDGRSVLLSDTVGFLQNLPHHLVASFHATLEETLNADLLLHVVDASHPEASIQLAAVDAVLAQLSLKDRDVILVLNKIDRVEDPLSLQFLPDGRDRETLMVSAKSGLGLDRLEAAVRRRLDSRSAVVDVFLSPGESRTASEIRKLGGLIEEEHLTDPLVTRLRTRLTESALGTVRRMCGNGARLVVVEAARDGSARSRPDVHGDAGDRLPEW